jgi:hypothetical protein
MQQFTPMSYHFELMLGFGMVLFTVGAVARTYMNAVIRQSPLSKDSGTNSTELRYWRLIKERGARVWPFWVTVVCMPLGVLLAFASIIWSNNVGGR